ncbi:MAG: hypothetical protein JXR37_19330 [Kiritimatiellae bacterium]|nr:hypothetical protein [Kiritimatiellia bacterium]
MTDTSFLRRRTPLSRWPALLGAAVWLCACALTPCAFCADRVMVAFNRAGQYYPSRDLTAYDLRVHRYTAEKLDASFCARLAEAQILYIGQYAGSEPGQALFADAERSAAVLALLKRGGLLFFDYAANPDDAATRKFFAGLGLEHPGAPAGKGYDCAAAPDSRSRLLSEPHKIEKRVGKAYGAWDQWPSAYDAPIRDARDSARAAMLVKTGVAGKGTIVLSQMPEVFRDKTGAAKDLADNIIALAFGKLPAPGKTVAVYDAFERAEPAANVLYLKNAARVRWHFEDSTFRIPFLLAEPIGMPRRAAPVGLVVTLPAGAAPGSVRICEAWGTELPCQVQLLDSGAGRIECVFEADLDARETRLLFLYGGNTPVAPPPAAPYGFTLTESDDGFLLRNDRIQAELDKRHAVIGLLKATGSGTRNELATWGAIDPGRANWISYGGAGIHPGAADKYEAAIQEDGAVRKRVRYTSPKLEVVYTLYAGGGAVFYSLKAAEPLAVSRFSGWAPYGDGIKDTLWYEADEGLKQLGLQTGVFYRDIGEIRKHMKENWLAIADARGAVVGEFADRPLWGAIAIGHHQANGESVKISGKLAAGTPACGAFVAAQGEARAVRDAYVAWKNPPERLQGELQRRDAARPPAVPRFGREFMLQIGDLHWFGATCGVSGDVPRAERVLTEIEKLGGNTVNLRPGRREFVDALIPRAHSRGMGVVLHVPLPNRGRPCPLEERAASAQATESVASLNVEGVYLLDEYEFQGTSQFCREAFRKEYGMDMPARPDLAKLTEPAQHNVILFKMDAITGLVRAMTEAARAKNPDVMTFHVTSPNNHYRLVAYHDLERQSDYLTTTCTDLYSVDLAATKYMCRHIRGAQGNEKPALTVNGCKWNADETRLNAKQHLFAGANGLWHFSFTFLRTYPDVTGANAEVFHWLTRTGMGDLLARSRPARYLAVFRDRDAFVDCIKRGELSGGRLTAYEDRIRELCLMRNVPTDILFSKYLSAGELRRYRVLILPSERVLSAERARAIAEYVRAGGRVIVEGETVRNPLMAEICGVKPAGSTASAGTLKGTAAPLAGLELDVGSPLVPLETGGATVLASAGGKPAVTLATAGRGRAVCVALTQLPAEVVKTLVRALGGRRPVEPPAELEEKIDTNVLTDGKRCVIVAHNPHYAQRYAARLDTAGLGAAPNAVAIDFDRGLQRPHNGSVDVELGPNGFAFVAVAAPDDFTMPQATGGLAAMPPSCSAAPGMAFLRIQATEKAENTEREKEPGKLYVGVFKTQTAPPSALDMGAEAMMAALQSQPGLAPEFIDTDSPATLAFYDVVVIPNMKTRAPNLSEQWQRNLRAYVEKGGGALLVHHSAGYPSTTPPVFPEVATAPDYVPITAMQVAAEHPVTSGESMRKRFPQKAADPAFEQYFRATQLQAGQEFVAGFPDYIKLKPGNAGKVLVKSAVRGGQGGDPVVVAGAAGKGKVVLSGMNIACRAVKADGKQSFEEALTPGEQAILINSVYWLAE